MSKHKIGQIVEDQKEHNLRDCHHVASILVKSEENLVPGQDIIVDTYGNATASTKVKRNAIVDPFIAPFKPGTLFWALLEPSLVSSVHHNFKVEGVQEPHIAVPFSNDDERDNIESSWDCLGCY